MYQTLTFRRICTPSLDFTELVKLISTNPSLHSLSVENIQLFHEIERPRLEEFVATLDAFPLITCLYMDGKSFCTKNDHHRSMLTVLEQRLSKIDNSKVKALKFMDASELTRSRRGLSNLTRDGDTRIWPGGRWENERHKSEYHWDTLAVLEHNGLMQVCLPGAFLDTAIDSILARHPGLRQLAIKKASLPPSVFQELPIKCPEVQELDLQLEGVKGQDLARFLRDPRVKLTSLSLHRIESGVYREALQPLLLQPMAHFFRHALVEVTFRGTSLAMSSVLEILTLCYNLRVLSGGATITGSEPEECPMWASQLRSVDLGLYIKGNRPLEGSNSSDGDLALSTLSANMKARAFMEQLGYQTSMRELTLHFNGFGHYGTSPFLKLTLGCAHGLGQLAKLSRLEKFVVCGLLHDVGPAEITWMKQHWPRLKTIKLPVIKPGTRVPAKAIGHEAFLPDYRSWYPDIDVQIPFETLNSR